MSEGTPQQPSEPAIEVKQPGLKFLEAAVYIMGGLLVLMLVGLIGGIIWKATHRAPSEIAAPTAIDIETAMGTAIGQMALDGDRLAIHLNHAGGEEIVVVDVRKGSILARIRLKPAAGTP